MLICFLVWLPIGFWSRDSTTTSTQRAPWLSHSVPALDNNSRHLHRPSQIQPSHLLHAACRWPAVQKRGRSQALPVQIKQSRTRSTDWQFSSFFKLRLQRSSLCVLTCLLCSRGRAEGSTTAQTQTKATDSFIFFLHWTLVAVNSKNTQTAL